MIVQAVCPDGASRPGIIQAANADGSYAVRWLSGSTSDVEPHGGRCGAGLETKDGCRSK